MRRVLMVFMVALVTAAMLGMTAAPAMAQTFTLPTYNPCWPIATDPRCPTQQLPVELPTYNPCWPIATDPRCPTL
jgi:hypothetical protein